MAGLEMVGSETAGLEMKSETDGLGMSWLRNGWLGKNGLEMSWLRNGWFGNGWLREEWPENQWLGNGLAQKRLAWK